METETQTRREELESLVKQSKREILIGLAKTVGWITLPSVALGAIIGATKLVTSPLENPDLKHLLNVGIPFVLGGASSYFASASGMIEDYEEKFRDLVSDIRYAGQRAREYRTEISKLE